MALFDHFAAIRKQLAATLCAVALLIFVLAQSALAMSQASADALASSLLAKSGRTNGVWSVPHCGSGELVMSFWNQRGQDTLLIDAFDSSGSLLQSAQQKASLQGVLGRNVCIYPISTGSSSSMLLSRMPYADNFVDMVAMTGLTDADLPNTSYAEIERVLSPGAKAWVGRAAAEGGGVTVAGLTSWMAGSHPLSTGTITTDSDGTFAVITKVSQLPNTDEWSSRDHGPDGNRVSGDTKLSWPFLPQWKMKPYDPLRSFEAAGGGRLYSFQTYGPNYSLWNVQACRLSNGQPLWTNTWPYVPSYYWDTVADQIFAGSDYICMLVEDAAGFHILVIDGETGSTRNVINLPAPFGNPVIINGSAVRYANMVLSNNIAYAVDYNNIVAYDIKNSVLLYNKLLSYTPCCNIRLSGSNIYLSYVISFSPQTTTPQTCAVCCYDALTGNQKWMTSPSSPNHNILRASKYGVACLYSGSHSAVFLSASDGSVIWQKTLSGVGSNYCLNDAVVTTDSNFVFNFVQVYQPGYSGGGCGYSALSPMGQWSSDFARYRTSCATCPIPAEGLLFFTPRGCFCADRKGAFLAGSAVEAPLGTFNLQVAVSGTERLEQGEAYTNWTPAVTTDNLDWATYRGNNKRNAFSPATASTSPVLLWTHSNAYPYSNYRSFSDSSDSATEHRPTPLVTSSDYVYYAGSDGVVNCLSAVTGNLVWSYPTGGFIFAAPTVWNGGVYVGAGDGYVYCLEAHTGRLRWRFRAAPTLRRMNDWGHLMNSWPVMTGVLIQDGYAYFCSGIYAEYGAQAYKVDAVTGNLVWANTQAGSPGTIYQPHGISPLGTMTIAGNQLWVKGLYYNAAFDLTSGSMTMYSNPANLYNASDPILWDGIDIGVYGHYVVCGGRPLYPSDIYTGAWITEGGDGMQMVKVDSNGLPIYPALQVTSPASPTLRLGFWTDTSFNGCDDGTLTSLLDGQVANGNPALYSSSSSLLGAGNATNQNWPNPNKYVSFSEVYAGCSNGYFYTNSSNNVYFQPTSGSPWIPAGSVRGVNPGHPTLYNGLSIDRSGNFIVTLVTGDVLCYGKAGPTITWSNPANITYGTALTAAQLNASTSVPGSLAYTPAAGTVLNAGTGQALNVVATPNDPVTYNRSGKTVTINVLPQALTVTAANATRTTGTANPAFAANYSGLVNGDTAISVGLPLTYTCTADATTPAGTYLITPGGPSATANYSVAYQSGTLTIVGGTQSQTIAFGALPVKTYGNAPFVLNASASSGLPVHFAGDNPAAAIVSGSTVTLVGPGTAHITASQVGNGIYAAAPNVTQTLTVNSSIGNADLAGLALSSGTLSPVFSSSGTSYKASVPNSVTSVAATPTLSDPAATFQVTGGSALAVGANTITVRVTASDLVTVKSYTVIVTRGPSSIATLSGLALSSGTLNQTFTQSGTSYTANVVNSVTSVTVMPTLSDTTATVQITGGSPLAIGTNTITVKVTAQDGITTKTYTIIVTRASYSNNDNLSNLLISSGSLTTSSTVTTIRATAPYDASSITVTPILSDTTASFTITNPATLQTGAVQTLAIGTTQIRIKVTAQDSVTAKTYTLFVSRYSNSNANLAGLVLSSGTLNPAFSSSGTSYTASVPNSITSVSVTPTLSDTTATVNVTGGTALAVGANTITATVTAGDGVSTKTYTILMTRGGTSHNADLSSLVLSPGTLSPAFSSSGTSYSATVENNVTAVTVTPTVSDTSATYQVTGGSPLVVGTNTITVAVTANDLATVKTYTVALTRAPSSNANLLGLVLSAGTLSPTFTSGGLNYTASVANGVTNITATPTLSDTTASVQVAGGTNLAVGPNTLTATVTAQDGVTAKVYTVVVTRAGGANANLSGLVLSSGTISPVFSSSGTSYSTLQLSGTITVTPILSDTTASVQVRVNGGAFSAVASGSASPVLALNVGDNPIEAKVTAADNVTTKSYVVIATDLLATAPSLLTVTGTDSLRHVAVSYWRYHNAASSAILYEASATLACNSWSTMVLGTDIQESILTVNGNVEQVQAVSTKSLLQLGTPFFLRLRVGP